MKAGCEAMSDEQAASQLRGTALSAILMTLGELQAQRAVYAHSLCCILNTQNGVRIRPLVKMDTCRDRPIDVLEQVLLSRYTGALRFDPSGSEDECLGVALFYDEIGDNARSGGYRVDVGFVDLSWAEVVYPVAGVPVTYGSHDIAEAENVVIHSRPYPRAIEQTLHHVYELQRVLEHVLGPSLVL